MCVVCCLLFVARSESCVAGCLLVVCDCFDCSLFVVSFFFVFACCLLVVCCCLFVVCCLLLVIRCSSVVVRCLLLVVVCCLLLVGCC